jgi:hypothetical protein
MVILEYEEDPMFTTGYKVLVRIYNQGKQFSE